MIQDMIIEKALKNSRIGKFQIEILNIFRNENSKVWLKESKIQKLKNLEIFLKIEKLKRCYFVYFEFENSRI